MTAIVWDTLNSKAYQHFDCQWISAVQRLDKGITDKQHLRRIEKQKRVFATLTRFRQAIESSNPPRTKAEAVKMLSPFLAWILWSVFRTLAIAVIEWAWDELHRETEI